MTSRMLFDEDDIRMFNAELAKVIGVNESIVLQQIHYWLTINQKANNNYKKGRYWTYNTYKDWQEDSFPFWSTRTISRIIKKLEEEDYIFTDNFNKEGFDKTKWYSINYDKLNAVANEVYRTSQTDSTNTTDCHNGEGQNDSTNTKDFSKTSSKTSSSSTFGSSNSYPTLSKLERTDGGHRKYPKEFEDLWEVYPDRQGSANKGGGYEKFRARIKEGIPYKKLFEGVKTYFVEQKNKDNINTPYVMQMKKFFGTKDIWLEYAEKDLTEEGGNDKVSGNNGRKTKTTEEQKEEWREDFANFSS